MKVEQQRNLYQYLWVSNINIEAKPSHIKLKEFFDIVFSLILLSMIIPFWLIISLLIKLDSKGPVFFRQWRVGKGGKKFKIYKFRTMFKDAPFLSDREGAAITKENDPRITRLGKILRKYSIDETPQLINVILGEMSLVGPRPELPEHYLKYTPIEKIRLIVKPGMTGLSQINGRNSITWRERKQYDVKYVKNWSLKLDFKIILKTVPVILQGAGVFKNE